MTFSKITKKLLGLFFWTFKKAYTGRQHVTSICSCRVFIHDDDDVAVDAADVVVRNDGDDDNDCIHLVPYSWPLLSGFFYLGGDFSVSLLNFVQFFINFTVWEVSSGFFPKNISGIARNIWGDFYTHCRWSFTFQLAQDSLKSLAS